MKKLLIAFLLLASVCGAQTLLPFSPVGEIKMYGGLAAPSGFLLCDGTLASTTTYPDLSAVIRAQYTRPTDPADSFRVPDLRGVYPKGFGQNGVLGANYASASGTPQLDKTQSHIHNVRDTNNGPYLLAASAFAGGGIAAVAYNPGLGSVYLTSPVTDGSYGSPRLGPITEPANVGVSFIIKY
jgi:microcystin-dependent protein